MGAGWPLESVSYSQGRLDDRVREGGIVNSRVSPPTASPDPGRGDGQWVPVPQDHRKWDRGCWHQEKAGILGKSESIDTHRKANQCLVKELINKQMIVHSCAESPGLGKGRGELTSQYLCELG